MYAIALIALGVHPIAQAPGRTSTWSFRRGADELLTIVASHTEIRERVLRGETTVSDRPIRLRDGQALIDYVTSRAAGLELNGWNLTGINTTFDYVADASGTGHRGGGGPRPGGVDEDPTS